jgi:2-C-methyl-D-erythritol 4-phosphate cytidylyltransferase
MIDNVSLSAYEHHAAAACVKIKDTIKLVGSDGFIKDTIDRNTLLAVQTPQTFLLKLYMAGMAVANQRGINLTDDCQLIEQAGGKIFAVEGSYHNIKITTPEDIAFAEYILNDDL